MSFKAKQMMHMFLKEMICSFYLILVGNLGFYLDIKLNVNFNPRSYIMPLSSKIETNLKRKKPK